MNPFPASLRSRILNDPYYRLRSLQEIQIAASLGVKIDANQACVDDWLRLPGLSIHQARMLVNLSQSGVQFHCLEDLAAALSLPVQRLKPLEPVLSFHFYDADSIFTVTTVNVNTAALEHVLAIPGMDAGLAKALVEQRQQTGLYRNLADLQQRLSLPATLVTELMHYLRF
ncbi:hypothetical protein DO97_08775 [Neosynechococcus sphagnicola sy1]|uniref:DNA uptake protein n=1 Tax=Neosynechococcus sphagnicola sy1 TaxID=1497020 RepID=A0A098TKS7_9CYAN|nr:ComEA family DNA-binding protein [Neosynechococcus sphagnicola]KGF72452.1 hypothetical protein DO97_08775 [Neosynechococcus sphagnicola sy1]